jgi:ABC-type dipeptide/oligopeptide/nickel transport system ATPase component
VTVQAQILRLLGDLRREFNMAMLLITHDLALVADHCDDVAVMYAGRVAEKRSVAGAVCAARPSVYAGPAADCTGRP